MALTIISVEESLKIRMRNAAVEGFLNFIRLGVPVTLLLLAWTWLIIDYTRVRVQASQGAAVFQMVEAQARAQKEQGGK